MNTKHFFGCLLFLTFGSNAAAVECHGEPFVEGFKLADIKVKLDQKADEINAKWVEDSSKFNSDEALVRRQKRIDQVYNEYTEQRKKAYSEASCTIRSTKKCASTAGRKNFCPIRVDPPSNRTYFDVSKLVLINHQFQVTPQLSGTAIIYTVKKTGRGSNTAGFQVPVRYKQTAINSMVNNDIKIVTDYLQDRIKIANPNANVHGTIAADCSNIASELMHLKMLRDSGALSQAEYNNLHSQKLKNCLTP